MSRVDSAAAMDRLPWLPDEPSERRAGRRTGIALVLTIFAIVVAVAFWLGARSAQEQPPATRSHKAATIRLPSPRLAAPAQPQVAIARPSEIEPIVAPPLPIVEPPPPVRAPERAVMTTREPAEPAPVIHQVPKAVEAAPPQPWPVRAIEGADGRLVRIGAFSSVHQAKRGWWAIVRVNPALKHLPALVVPVQSLRNGRIYYRLQMGTTSQAHSTVLCQRMRMIAQPCVVIGIARPQ